MRKLIIVTLLLNVGLVRAETQYLGTERQEVFTTEEATSTIKGVKDASGDALDINADGSLNATVSGMVGVSGPVSVTGNVGATILNPVQVTSSNTVIKDAGGDALAINADGSINANTTVTSAGVFNVEGTTLATRVVGMPDLSNKSAVAASSNNMAVSDVVSLTGLAKSIDLLAVSGSCSFTINDGGGMLVLSKNSSESYDYAFTLVNASVTLNAKDAGAVCKTRLKGAN